jgi:hypothetical protein
MIKCFEVLSTLFEAKSLARPKWVIRRETIETVSQLAVLETRQTAVIVK